MSITTNKLRKPEKVINWLCPYCLALFSTYKACSSHIEREHDISTKVYKFEGRNERVSITLDEEQLGNKQESTAAHNQVAQRKPG